MPVWHFPTVIPQKTCPYIYIQFQTEGGNAVGDDKGEARYIMDSGKQFKIEAGAAGGFHLQGGP